SDIKVRYCSLPFPRTPLPRDAGKAARFWAGLRVTAPPFAQFLSHFAGVVQTGGANCSPFIRKSVQQTAGSSRNVANRSARRGIENALTTVKEAEPGGLAASGGPLWGPARCLWNVLPLRRDKGARSANGWYGRAGAKI